MKASLRYTLLLALVLAVILILLAPLTTPLIYSLEQDTFPSRFHNNTDALKRQSLNSSEDILPLMQELSGYTGPIILNVRLDDPEQARRDLALFAKNRVALNTLIVKLDMTESEMREYAKNRALQNQILAELVNSSVSLEELKKLEIQYRDADKPTMLMSVQLEGEALRERIQELYDQYEKETALTVATGKHLGIDTSAEEESVSSFRKYVGGIAPPTRSSYEVPPRRTNLLTLVLLPEQASYGDTLTYSGYLFSPAGLRYAGIPGRNVTLYLDNEPFSVLGTDSSGGYATRLPVEQIAAGTHAVHAASGTTLSETRMLTVDWADSVTTLSVSPLTRSGEVTASGSVSAGVPVRNGPVDIIRDGTVILKTTTNANGQFKAVVNLPPGTHTLVARFTGDGFPVRPSGSEPSVIDVPLIQTILPADYSNLVLATALVITFVLFAGGAFWYLTRMRGDRNDLLAEITRILKQPGAPNGELPKTPGLPEFPAEETSGDVATAVPEPLFTRYVRVLQEHGISEAAFAVYRDFSRRIAHDQQIRGYASLTPGELSRSCRNRPYCSAFSRFVSVYETVRYGGRTTGTVRTEFEAVLQHTDTRIGGEDHQD